MATTTERHPAGFKYIFWAELGERASYYGVLVLLTSYMIKVLGFDEGKAGAIGHGFKALAYLFPLAGGYVADRYIGKFKTVLLCSIPYILGHLVLGEFQTEGALYLALALLVVGVGALKPNVLPLMHLMYDEAGKSEELRQKATSYFYASINIGAVASMLAVPWVRTKYGYGPAFLLPAALMIFAIIMFYFGKKHYPTEVIERKEQTADEKAESWRVLTSMAGIFFCYIFFWVVYDQQNTSWVFLAEKMERYGFEPDTIQWLNPALIMLFVPLSNKLWGTLKAKGYDIAPTKKMYYGFMLTALTAFIMAVAGYSADNGGQPSLIWQVLAYIVLGMAEMCLSVVGLDFAVSQAPKRMKSLVLAVFMLTIFAGNTIDSFLIASYQPLGACKYFLLQFGTLLIVAVIFSRVAKKFNEKTVAPETSPEGGIAPVAS